MVFIGWSAVAQRFNDRPPSTGCFTGHHFDDMGCLGFGLLEEVSLDGGLRLATGERETH